MDVKIDGGPLDVGNELFMVQFELRKFLTILLTTGSMDEFCLGCPFIRR